MRTITTIGFDADDTLWHNERYFRMTEARLAALLADHAPADEVFRRLTEAERRNIGRYGFGIKGFVLSQIETALEVTEDAVPGRVIREIIEAGKEMLAHPIELLPDAADTVRALAGRYRLVLITKGDLLDQERKLAQSGLGEWFDAVEIVSEKTPEVYIRAFMRHGDGPERAVMVGNSLRSDVVPAIEAGAHGVHVPHETTWIMEHAPKPQDEPRFHEIASLAGLPQLLERIQEGARA